MNLRRIIFGRSLGTILVLGTSLHSCAPKDDAAPLARSPVQKPDIRISDGAGRPEAKSSKLPRPVPEEPAARFIRKKMKSIIIPVIAFDDTSVEEAIDFLRVRSIELDPDAPKTEAQGISFIVRKPRENDAGASLESAPASELGETPEPGAARLTIHARNISLWDALHRVADQAGLQIEITDRGIQLKAR